MVRTGARPRSAPASWSSYGLTQLWSWLESVHSVALTGVSFEDGSIEDLDVAASIMDGPLIAQPARSLGHAFPLDAERVGDELVGHGELVARQPVEGQQEPPA